MVDKPTSHRCDLFGFLPMVHELCPVCVLAVKFFTIISQKYQCKCSEDHTPECTHQGECIEDGFDCDSVIEDSAGQFKLDQHCISICVVVAHYRYLLLDLVNHHSLVMVFGETKQIIWKGGGLLHLIFDSDALV